MLIFSQKRIMSVIEFKIENQVGIIRLTRPNVFNSVNRALALKWQELLDHCADNDDVRAIYMIGEGKAFCAGQDLQEVTDPNGPELTNIVAEHYNPIVEKIRNIEKPVVAAVNGVAAGAGANIALACDICVAVETASFIQAFSKIGLIPDSAGTYFLPRIIGIQKASALMMLGDKVSATEAEAMGMIYKVFSTDTFESESLKIAQTLAQMPTKALGMTKRALNQTYHNSLSEQLALEGELQTIAGKTEDYEEGVNAFVQKRKPLFKGK